MSAHGLDSTADDDQEAVGNEHEDGVQAEATLDGAWQQLEGTARPPSHPRFLAWNGFGHVASFPDLLRLEVWRRDEKPVGLPDYDGLHLAAMSAGAVCLAARSTASGGSRVVIRPTQRWEKALFSAPLGSAESPEAIACGEDFVAVLTSSRSLRLYSFSGLPLGLLSTPGDGVALAARGSMLLAVTRSPGTDVEDNELDFQLLDVKSRAHRASGHLPLGDGARLRWLGISEDFVPLTVDTSGVVRALLGSGAGSWCANGLAEWTPVLSLADEETPMWVIDAPTGALLAVEVLNNREPWPRPREAEGLGESTEASTVEPFFGVGGTVSARQLPWKLCLGVFPAAGEAIEAAFRDQLLLRHLQDLLAMDMLNEDQQQQQVDALEKRCKSGVLKLFTLLAKCDEVERAHHVAKFYLASMGGTAKVLDMARMLAEKAKQHRLADEIAALPRPIAPAPKPELPPLFKPGEFEEPGSETREVERSAKEDSKVAPCDAPAEPKVAGDIGELPVLPAAPSSARATPSNPFARKRPGAAPGRQPATPMASGSGSPHAKVARLT